MSALCSALVALAVSLFVSGRLARPGNPFATVEVPNARSLHQQATPGGGGLGVLVGLSAGAAVWFLLEGAGLIPGLFVTLGLLLLVSVSALDDRLDLPSLGRFVVHLLAAVCLLAGDLRLDHLPLPGGQVLAFGAFTTLLTLALVVWIANLFNFMDGMDGFAGGMGSIGFGFLALHGALAGHPAFTAFNLVLSFACLGFLRFNFPPARVFMGDVGSIPLGYCVAVSALWGVQQGVFVLWVPLLVFSPFFVDASFTLVRRMARREPFWRAHRSHCYQRLAAAGWGHRKTTLAEYVLMVSMGGAALAFPAAGAALQWVILGATAALYATLILLVRAHERAYQQQAS